MKLLRRPDDVELYDLNEDPEEQSDFSGTEPDALASLTESLESKLAEMELLDDVEAEMEFADGVEGRLRNLGYLE